MSFFTSDLRRNLTKIVCLTTGLAIGFLLVAKIFFQQTYDSNLPDSDRIYYLTESITRNGKFEEYSMTPGAFAPGARQYVPQVESATRITRIAGQTSIRLDDNRTFEIKGLSLADSCFFDVLGTDIIEGNPHETLNVIDQCMIPKSLADKIGGNVIGLQFCVPSLSEDYKVTIAGVYEDYPLNSSISNCIYVSLSTIGRFSYDGRNNWVGNDRYNSYIKLVKGTKVEDIQPYIDKMTEENVDEEAREIYDFRIGYKPLVGYYSSNPSVKTMIWLMSILAVIMLMCSGLNYLLIVVGQMGHRSKEMAVRKCYGTSNTRLFGRVMGESLFFLLISIALAILLVFCFADLSHRLLGYTPAELLSNPGVWIVEGAVCLLLLIITGVIPAWIYCRTPVAHAFRSYKRNRRAWKLILLFIQFFATGLIMCLLVLIGRQYHMMVNIDMGFNPENVGFMETSGLDPEKTATVAEELKRLGCVRNVAFAYHDFTSGAAGNNVWTEGHEHNDVNVADMYSANPEIIDVLGMRLLQGEPFSENADSTTMQVIVEKKFAEILRSHFGVQDSMIVGQTFHITEHVINGNNEYTICGVIDNIRRGGVESSRVDSRPGVIFPAKGSGKNMNYLYVRFDKLDRESLHQAQEVIDRVLPTRERYIISYKTVVMNLHEPVRRFGTSVVVVGIAILLIALIGLIGYTTDEVQHRAKEIAIRKVTGSDATKIVKLFCVDILRIAVPSLILGGAVAILIGRRWLTQFTEQVSLSPASMVLCIILLILILVAVVTANTLSIARSNPVDHLRNE